VPVNGKECKSCQFERDCQYFHGDNDENLTDLIADPDGTCTMHEPREDSTISICVL